MRKDTGVKCVVCKKGRVVAIVESVTRTPTSLIPIGPGSRSHYHREITSIHCEKCGVKYEFPPGKPGGASKILSDISKAEERTQNRRLFENIESLAGDMQKGLKKKRTKNTG